MKQPLSSSPAGRTHAKCDEGKARGCPALATLDRTPAGGAAPIADASQATVALLADILEAVPDGVIATDRQERVLWCNGNYARLWDVPADVLGRRSVSEFIAQSAAKAQCPDDAAKALQQLFRAPGPVEAQTIALSDGRWVEVGVRGRAGAGSARHQVLWYRDVTERETARREAARLRFIFESVPVGLSLRHGGASGVERRLINDAHLAICGMRREQAEEPEFFQRISHPDDYRQQVIHNARLDAGEITGYEIEKRYFRPDGSVVWVALSLQRRMLPDGSFEELSTVVDITALKLAQETIAREQTRLKFIFESIPVGISLMVMDAKLVHVVNPAHERITGISADRLAEPGVFERATVPEDFERQRELVKRYKEGAIDRFTLEKRYIHADGRIVWASLTRRMFVDPVTGTRHSITTIVDINDRKHAEAKLAETYKRLVETSRQAGMAEVATGVLHNVGNVLNSVNVSASLMVDLVRRAKGPTLGKLAELISAQTDLAGFLTSDPRGVKVPAFLSALAKHLAEEQSQLISELESLRRNVDHIKEVVALQQGYAKVSGASETVGVAELVEDAVRINAESFARHGITLKRNVDSRLSLNVEKHKVLQILVNLLQNAKNACDESMRRDKVIEISAIADADRVLLRVTDNGIGIQRENLTRIFAHGFTTRKRGHGFGLHSSAISAKEIGGALTAASPGPGEGASFTLELPLSASSP